MTWMYGIGVVTFQIANLIRHPSSYAAAWILAASSFAGLMLAVYAQYEYSKLG